MLSTTNVSQRVRSALAILGFGLLSVPLFTFPVALAAERATDLAQQLIELGWSSYQASDGTVTLTPPTGKANVEKEGRRATNPTSSNSFRQQLLGLGWRLAEESDGTLVFFPPPAVQAKPQSGVSTDVDKHGVGSSDSSMRAVEKLLAGPGWKVEEDLDGTTRLIPAAALQVERVSEPGMRATVTSSSLASDIRTKLESQGWTLTPSADGSIVLFPPSAQGVGEISAPVQQSSELISQQMESRQAQEEGEPRCGWWIADTLLDNTLKLPVDTWAEAQSIAQSWLSHEAGSDLRTGKIRKVIRIYLISIVEDQPPYKLRHQLAVRAEDGHLAVLY
jgi:hypothetical protein